MEFEKNLKRLEEIVKKLEDGAPWFDSNALKVRQHVWHNLVAVV